MTSNNNNTAEDSTASSSPPPPQKDESKNFTEDEEEECRVCRGPAEEGRPLYAPCKCSGSIGLTHQDCLSSWLAVTRGDGRCELCSYHFQFAPKYAPNTPSTLPPIQVLSGLLRRLTIKWLPLLLRVLLAASLWLLLLPLATAYLYHGWMHRPSSILTRWKWDLVAGDCVSGAVVAAVIVVSFLSLMSFADFLRFHWQQRMERVDGAEGEEELDVAAAVAAAAAAGGGEGRGGGEENNNVNDDEPPPPPIPNFAERAVRPIPNPDPGDGVNAELGDVQQEERPHAIVEGNGESEGVPKDDGEVEEVPLDVRRGVLAAAALRRQRQQIEGEAFHEGDEDLKMNGDKKEDGEVKEAKVDEMPVQENPRDVADDEDMKVLADMMRIQEEKEELQNEAQQAPGMPPPPVPVQPRRDGNRNRENEERPEAQFDPIGDPAFDADEAMDVEIHVALDELLGFRGPLPALVRNLLWLLAFNTTYLGLFAFIPHTIGSSVFSTMSNSTFFPSDLFGIPPSSNSTEIVKNATGIVKLLNDLNGESRRLNTVLLLPDLATVALGYVSMALMVFALQGCVALWKRFQKKSDTENAVVEPQVGEGEDVPIFDRMGDRMPVEGNDGEIHEWDMDDIDHDAAPNLPGIRAVIAEKLGFGLECAAAIVKVGILLFLKMFLLPLLLGMWLDVSTLPLFEKTIRDRVSYAGADLFGSVLLHWVVGITFMLVVTVSVLQLREVAHPDLLARIIRPQEPQPDLLGNLLHESGSTHAKRMLLSLGIYAALLSIHVWLPAKLLVLLGMGQYLPFFRPKISHVVLPQLQLPIELLIFHLSMLAFLEKYKNHIGDLQHLWLVWLCRKMGLTDRVLPRAVQSFELVGTRSVYLKGREGPSSEKTEESLKDAEPTNTSPTKKSKNLHLDPFWTHLITLQNSDADHFIRANIQSPTNPTSEVGMSKRNGQRVLNGWHPSIIVATPSSQISESEEGSTDGETKMNGGTSSNNLDSQKLPKGCFRVPSTIGTYHLRRGMDKPDLSPALAAVWIVNPLLDDESTVIEFWRECPGKPITRPPEGWDDLGVGGAEIQGRWAWGNERKSEVEEGVAKRTPFFTYDSVEEGALSWRKLSWWKAATPVFVKMVLLLLLSWLAVLVAVCLAMSAPLVVGRFVYFLLRVPDRMHHDPLAFAIGGAVLFPIIYNISEFLGTVEGDNIAQSLSERLKAWRTAYSPPPPNKFFVVLQAALHWFFISPLLLGVTYELLIVKSLAFWESNERLYSASSLAVSWGAGLVFLNLWAVLCYFGVFRRDFWVRIGIAAGNVAIANADENAVNAVGNARPNGANQAARLGLANDALQGRAVQAPENGAAQNRVQEQNDDDDDMQQHNWQGDLGVVHRFFNIMSSVLSRWEWDKIDSTVLLDEFALPVSRHISISLFLPVLLYLSSLSMCSTLTANRGAAGIVVPFLGFVDKGTYRLFLFRTYAITVISVQLAFSFKKPLRSWFSAVHRAARDDRYLVGEVLLDYVAPK